MGNDEINFEQVFKELTRNEPLSWQRRLYGEWIAGDVKSVIDLPTGLGKTMVMAIWLIARLANPALGRRLIYVVDRRTVVDQATDLARLLIARPVTKFMHDYYPELLAISTLRGQLADNREWSRDPSRPGIIIGTVDLIGSGLLFSGYRSGFKSKPLQAGLLGQDSLLVLDDPPIIIAPKHKVGQAITRFVPNNDGDKKFDRQERLTAKPTIPTLFLLEPNQRPEVHYVWDIRGKTDCPTQEIEKAARSLTTLGWGIDMALADARLADEAELQQLKAVRWYPKPGGGSFEQTLRVPTYYRDEANDITECTLCDLRHCHSTAMNRVEHGKPLKTVDKPKVFDRVLYTSVERPAGRPFRTFRIECDDEARRFTYPQSKLIHIAGMVKHLAVELMKLTAPRELRKIARADWLRAYVAGHQSSEDKAAGRPHTQFSYVPVQSIGMDHTDPGVRRVMLVAPVGDEAWLDHLAQRLDGMELRPLPNTALPPGTRLEFIADSKKDRVRDAYCKPSLVWASVTPVVLNRYVEKLKQTLPDGRVIDVLDRAEIQRQIVQALQQSGIDQPCEFEWSAFSHFRKMLSAHKYRKGPDNPQKKFEIGYVRPDHLVGRTAVHLVIRFGRRENPNDEKSRWIPADHPIPGPITIGAGRHCGFGLMAAVKDEA